MHRKALWQMNIEELDDQIRLCESILDPHGKPAAIKQHLENARRHREERLIEAAVLLGKKAKDEDPEPDS